MDLGPRHAAVQGLVAVALVVETGGEGLRDGVPLRRDGGAVGRARANDVVAVDWTEVP